MFVFHLEGNLFSCASSSTFIFTRIVGWWGSGGRCCLMSTRLVWKATQNCSTALPAGLAHNSLSCGLELRTEASTIPPPHPRPTPRPSPIQMLFYTTPGSPVRGQPPSNPIESDTHSSAASNPPHFSSSGQVASPKGTRRRAKPLDGGSMKTTIWEKHS